MVFLGNNHMIQCELDELDGMGQCDSDVLVAELTKNQQKIQASYELYYHKKQDESWIEHYYCSISFKNVTSIHLLKELQRLIASTHKYKHPYGISKDQYLYTWVDLQPNGQLKNIYSGVQKSPKIAIEEDFETIQQRFTHYRHLIKAQRYSDMEIDRHIRIISRQYKFNAEHVVPQSWFKAKEPMKGDLHHLFACEPECNSIRSNFPYHEFDSNHKQVSFRNQCGLYENGRFEPEYGKGAVARATLYFLLRYPTNILKKYKKAICLPLLIKWHETFPVNDYERHRNKAIFEIQGNRNPFIDFPHLAKRLAPNL